MERLDKGYCHDCQVERGAQPKEDVGPPETTHGMCKDCGVYTDLVADTEYDWPGDYQEWD